MLSLSTSGRATGVVSQTRTTRLAPALRLRAPCRLLCKAEKESATETDDRPVASTSISSQEEDSLPRSEIQKLSELRRDQQRGQSQSNIVQGAIEEAQLITWPTPKKAFFDTLLVLAIVSASGSLLFGLNVVLAEASEWWYSN